MPDCESTRLEPETPVAQKSEKWFHEELPMKRRTFLKAISLSVVPLSARHAFASEALTPSSPKWVKEYGLTPIGTLNAVTEFDKEVIMENASISFSSPISTRKEQR
jgi:hypothetical protein